LSSGDALTRRETAGESELTASLRAQGHRVAEYLLQRHRPSAGAAARRAFECFEPYESDAQEYARAPRWVDTSGEDEVVALLTEVRRGLSSRKRDRQLRADHPPQRYDAFMYLDTTRALHPLRDMAARPEAEVPKTYPSGV
jgi:hypothetical protein